MSSLHSPAARARRRAPVLIALALALATCLPAVAEAATSGPVRGWGANDAAQLGNGTTVGPRLAPHALFAGRELSAVSSGATHSVGLAADGTVWTWGMNTFGKLGDGTTVASDAPVKVPSLANIVAVDAGEDHSVALRADGAVLAWGDNARGQVGNSQASNPTLTPATVLQNAVAIAAGGDTTMALTRDGGVWTWGDNMSGQLGLNPALTGNLFRSAPQRLTQFGIGTANGPVEAIDQGCAASYAVLQNGAVWAWGANAAGQVNGGGSGTDFAPGAVPGPVGFADLTDVAAGCGFAIARKGDGTVWSWGEDDDGRLGTTEAAAQPPAAVPGLSDVTDIAAARATGFAIEAPGALKSWGDDVAGTVGDGGVAADAPAAVHLSSLRSGVAAVGAGSDGQHAFAIAQPLAVLSRESIAFGATSPVGGSTAVRSFSVTNDGAEDLDVSAVDLFGGDADAFAIAGDSCSAKTVPPGGDCLVSVRFAPVADGPATSFVRLTADGPGGSRLVRLDAYGTGFGPLPSPSGPVWAWGANALGQLGDGTRIQRLVPTQADGDAVAVAAGFERSFALRRDGTVWGFGSNQPLSTLGSFAGAFSREPVRIEGINAVTAVSAGRAHTMALRTDGTVWSWGEGAQGQLGHAPLEAQSIHPLPADGVSGVVAIAAGDTHSLALRSDGTVLAWGANGLGQTGGASDVNVPTLVTASGFTDIVDIAAGTDHSVALKADGTVWTWGGDGAGQLGNGSPLASSSTPVQVPGITSAVEIGAGGSHVLVRLASNAVMAWGEGSDGQLGDGLGADASSPVTAILPPATVVDVAAGRSHSLIRVADGRLFGFGDGANGAVGNGFTGDEVVPKEVALLDHGAGEIGGGPAAIHSMTIGRPHIRIGSPLKLTFDPPAPPLLGPGAVSNAQTVIVVNDGAAPMTIGDASIVAAGNAPDGDQFKITGDGCSGKTLARQAVCHIGVRYTPTVTETPTTLRVAFLHIPSDAVNGPGMVELDPPPAEEPAVTGDSAPTTTTAPPPPAAAKAGTASRTAGATCPPAKVVKGEVRLSCSLTGAGSGRRVRVWLVRGSTVVASGRAKVTGGKVKLRLKARRRIRRGTYTARVAVDGAGETTTRVSVR